MSSFPGTFKCLPGKYLVSKKLISSWILDHYWNLGIRCDDFTDYITDLSEDEEDGHFIPQHFFLSHCHADHMVG